MRNEKGFTLIELLVVVAIIGILVAIAIPQFASYRTQANNSAAQSQLRTLAVSEEAYFVNASAYTTTTSNLASYGYGDTTNVTVTVSAGTATYFRATAYHTAGNTTYIWDSSAGGLQ